MRPNRIWTSIEQASPPAHPWQRPWESESRIKLRYVALLAFVLVIAWAFTGCVQSEVVRKLPAGGDERVKSYGLTARAAYALDAGARHYLRMQVERSGK
jgi:hypothetical protein